MERAARILLRRFAEGAWWTREYSLVREGDALGEEFWQLHSADLAPRVRDHLSPIEPPPLILEEIVPHPEAGEDRWRVRLSRGGQEFWIEEQD